MTDHESSESLNRNRWRQNVPEQQEAACRPVHNSLHHLSRTLALDLPYPQALPEIPGSHRDTSAFSFHF
ncbi:hypothetical protein GQ44DRAFT_720540 [Phaeosphaeriaceae sp. PMI808]|nr:hypothetical protein GQ44DRAFT_720540 [Phaeosphaeriaceae sp. PMI808]